MFTQVLRRSGPRPVGVGQLGYRGTEQATAPPAPPGLPLQRRRTRLGTQPQKGQSLSKARGPPGPGTFCCRPCPSCWACFPCRWHPSPLPTPVKAPGTSPCSAGQGQFMSEVYYRRLSPPEQGLICTGPCAIGEAIAVRCPRFREDKKLAQGHSW